MVGVPGKFKGCETCRKRRLKCSNERPFCKNCIARGRHCEGYDRVRVFITATPEELGKVVRYAKKNRPEAHRQSIRPGTANRESHQTPSPPGDLAIKHENPAVSLTPARSSSRNAGLVAGLRHSTSHGLSPYLLLSNIDLRLHIRCFARLQYASHQATMTSGYERLYFEHDIPARTLESIESVVQRLGPTFFSQFPNYQFFVNVFRTLEVGNAMLERRETFLSAPEWGCLPWQFYVKDYFDRLIDLMLLLPPLLARIHKIVPLPETLERRTSAESLIRSLTSLQEQLTHWHQEFIEQEGHPSRTHQSISYSFKNGRTGVAFLHYWFAQLAICHRIETLRLVISQPLPHEKLPPNKETYSFQMQTARQLATEICRGLGSLLNILQPEILIAPMEAAMRCFRCIHITTQSVPEEAAWLESFHKRLMHTQETLPYAVRRQGLVEIAQL
ncbi:hypothetical protein B0J13DRAFT_455032 [Dactylonectria estremocensis]|uniref:Zn(2)-C6 fungal-type domain-containing protein n=1 Tax=Dactylonectria estremocensis TaxID=1079267 RepID=A0A9P9DTE1_9HYPO|nr:hypothetical protein B0J13DRAFT_455032 [Dactylonectria estremocensis]